MSTATEDKPSGEDSQNKNNQWVKWAFGLILSLLIFVFFSFYAKQFSSASLEIDLKDKKVAINTSTLLVSAEDRPKLDPEKYYIDSNLGFAFQKPILKDWLRPQTIHGIENFLDIKGAVLTQEIKDMLMLQMQAHPMGTMLRDVNIIRYATEETLSVETTDETTTEIAEAIIKNIMISEEFKDSGLSNREISEFKRSIRRNMIGFEKLAFNNEFTVYVYDKSKLKGVPVKHSLASIALTLLGQMGMFIDQLVADERSVFSGGTFVIRKASIDGVSKDFRIDRLWLVTESKHRYYMAEVGFSPQTKSSLQVWSELEAMLKSLVVID